VKTWQGEIGKGETTRETVQRRKRRKNESGKGGRSAKKQGGKGGSFSSIKCEENKKGGIASTAKHQKKIFEEKKSQNKQKRGRGRISPAGGGFQNSGGTWKKF